MSLEDVLAKLPSKHPLRRPLLARIARDAAARLRAEVAGVSVEELLLAEDAARRLGGAAPT